MRIVTLLILVSITQTFAFDAYAQSKRLSLTVKNETIVNILEEIEEQSEFHFMFDVSRIDVYQRKSVSCKNQLIRNILDQLFENTGIAYSINDRQVLLTTSGKSDSEQQKTVTGRVTDSGGSPLPGVTVFVKGSTQGTVTNADGEYSLANVSGDATLVFSFVGMKAQEVVVGSQANISIVMREDVIGIDEVVAIGYGTTTKKDLTGAVSTVAAKDFERVPATNPLHALQGRATGINITTTSGMPGEAASVRIRGVQTFRSSNNPPVFVVDGLITSGINNIDPNDIESVSVLKDASATAIYGARAANGVVLVTTKRGTDTGEPEITFNSYVGLQTQSNLKLNLLNASEFLEIYSEAYDNDGIQYDWTSEDLKYYQGVNSDWMDAILQTGVIQSYNLGVTGSSEKSNYYISGSYINHKGMVLESSYEKFSLRFNSDHKIKDWIRFGNSIMLYASDQDGRNSSGSSDAYELATLKVPITRVYEDNGDYGRVNNIVLEHNHVNPVWLAKEVIRNNQYKGVKGNLYLTLDLFSGLEFTARGNMEWVYRYGTEFNPGVDPAWGWEGSVINRISKSSSQRKHWMTDFLLNYSKTFAEDHKVKALAGYSIEEYTLETLGGSRNNTPNNEIRFLSAGDPAEQINNNGIEDWAFLSLFGRINYTYKDKYLLTASIRRDGSSRLADGNRFGIFPSASLAWRISEESFLDGASFLNDLKIRASWGEVGNVNSLREYATVASLGSQNYIFNNAQYPGYTLTAAINRNIKWESTKKKNLGIDAILFDNQLYSNVDFFIEDTHDLLFTDAIANSVGLSGSPYVNAGQIRNTGVEILLGYRKTVNNWSYDVSANASHIKNEAIDLAGRDLSTSGTIEGYPVNSYYGYTSNGLIYTQSDLDNNPHQDIKGIGDIWIVDVNGRDENGELTGKPDGEINSADRGIIGRRYPNFVYGFMGSVGYKNWSFQLQLQGVEGIDKPIHVGEYNNAYHYFTHWAMNHDNSILDRYHPTKNPNGKLPIVSLSDNGNNIEFSDFWLKDASYLRVKNVNLNYTFNKDFCNKLNMEGLGAYVSVQNLYTFTKFPGTEVDSSADIDPYTGVPQPTTWTIGIKATF